MKFQKQDVVLNVSLIADGGYWGGNSTQHVAKGTALGSEFTESIYTPPKEGLTAIYDAVLDVWVECEDKSNLRFFDASGTEYAIGVPDGDYPDGAIKKTPPDYDSEKQTVLYESGKWTVFDILIGQNYFSSDGRKHFIEKFNFIIPKNCTLIEPPKAKQGFAVKLVNDEWEQWTDHRHKVIYNKENGLDSKLVTELGDIETEWTLTPPVTQYDKWVDDAWVTDEQALFEAKIIEVDSTRRSLYSSMVDPLISEANIERLQGNEEAAVELETQALAAREKIRTENPWPTLN